jgi:transposase
MKPHSIAFRQKIIEVHEVEGISQRKLAKRFNVALSFIQKLLKQYRETDSLAPKVRTQQTPAKLNDEHLTVLRRLVEERNDATLEELRKQLIHETGIDVSRSTVDRALDTAFPSPARYDFGSEITVYQGSQGLCCTSRKREPL